MPAELPLPTVHCLTVTEAHQYVGSRALFDHLKQHCALKPIYDGLGHKKVLYRITTIHQALDILELNGGWDQTQQKAISETFPFPTR